MPATDTTPTTSPAKSPEQARRSRMRWLSMLVIAVVWLAAHVITALTGGGTRVALGTPHTALSDGYEISYYASGSGGPTVVLLASWARPASDFNELATSLKRNGFRTLSIESRGIGGSAGGGPYTSTTLDALARDVGAVLQASGIADAEPVHLIGHAFGNRVARTFATANPNRTRSLTLIAAGGRTPTPPELTNALFASTLTFLPWSKREPALRKAFFAESNPIPDFWRDGWSLWGGLAQAEAARQSADAAFWAGGDAPMLVFQAREDAVAPAAAAGLALAAEFPDRVTLVEVPNAAHAILPEQPAIIAKHTVRFLKASL